MKARYLTFFSYLGTNFRSSEKLWMKQNRNYPDPESIQGVIEQGLLRLKSLNYPNFVLSSRTDGGVHALKNSAHFDLTRYGDGIYYPEVIIQQVNKFLNQNHFDIFIKKCYRVNDNFNARFQAKSRTYLYRLAIFNNYNKLDEKTYLSSYIPIEEKKRCTFIRVINFDIEKFKEGAQKFVGYHDFSTFKKFDKSNEHKQNRRLIHSIDVQLGKPMITSYTQGLHNHFHYWDIKIHGRGFVHRQIRRMIGTLVAVGTGKLQPSDIQVMLQVPSKHSWHSFICCMPPEGLYLCDVEYDPQELIYSPEGLQNEHHSECDEEFE